MSPMVDDQRPGVQLAWVGAVVGAAALLLQAWLTIGQSVAGGRGWLRGLVFYLGFFTILTNMFATSTMAAHAVPGWGGRLATTLRRPDLLTSAAASMMVVGVVYVLVLQRLWNPQGAQWLADMALHYVMPAVTVLVWWAAIPRGALRARDLPVCAIYPAAYLGYVFARGAVLSDYPYFFIDVGTVGYPRALANTLGILLGFLTLCLLMVMAKSAPKVVDQGART